MAGSNIKKKNNNNALKNQQLFQLYFIEEIDRHRIREHSLMTSYKYGVGVPTVVKVGIEGGHF